MELAIQRALNEVNRPTGSRDMAVGTKVICKLKIFDGGHLECMQINHFAGVQKLETFYMFIRGT